MRRREDVQTFSAIVNGHIVFGAFIEGHYTYYDQQSKGGDISTRNQYLRYEYNLDKKQ